MRRPILPFLLCPTLIVACGPTSSSLRDGGITPDEDAGTSADSDSGPSPLADAGDLPPHEVHSDAGVEDAGALPAHDGGAPAIDPGDGGSAAADAGDGPMPPTDAGASSAVPPCPQFLEGTTTGFVLDLRVREASGAVASRRDADVLWVHNDSGSDPEIFALTTSGQARGKFILGGAEANDWEDIASGPGPVEGQSYLYLGDIGDNGESRATIDVYRVPEPAAGQALTVETLTDVERFSLAYPDRPHNAETLLVDPRSGDVFVVVKTSDTTSPVFRAAAPIDGTGTTVLEQVATLRFDDLNLSARLTTGGDISPAGDEIAIRTYRHAFIWRRAAGASVAEALATEPCPIPLMDEVQGEALGFAADGSGYFTLSEGQAVGLHAHMRQ